MKKLKKQWIILAFAVPVLAAFLVSHFFVGLYVVQGNSMPPSLKSGSVVLASKMPGKLKVGDIVVTNKNNPLNSVLIKRVAALPGQTGTVDGTKISPAAGTVFIVGDNEENSTDSRQIGAIPASSIEGKVVFCIYPIFCLPQQKPPGH